MYPQEFKALNKKLYDEVQKLQPRIKNPKYNKDVKQMLKKILPQDCIFFVGNELIYNIQSLMKNAWIFVLEEKVKVIVYKARPYGYPQIQGFQFFNNDDREKYLNNNQEQNCQDIAIESNNLIPEDQIDDVKNFIKMFFNKYPEKGIDEKGKLVDRDIKFLQVFKTFCYLKVESLFMHFALNQKKNFQYHIPQSIELENEVKFAKINFHLQKENKLFTLLMFEKEGENLDIWFKARQRWKEICIFLLLFSLLLILSSCKTSNDQQQNLLCRNKPYILFYLAISIIFFVGFKFVSKRREKKLRKKNN